MALWSAARVPYYRSLERPFWTVHSGCLQSAQIDRWETRREAAQKCPAFSRSLFLPEKVALLFCAPPVERNVLALSAAASCFVRTKQTQHLTHTRTHTDPLSLTHTTQPPRFSLHFSLDLNDHRTKTGRETDRSEVRKTCTCTWHLEQSPKHSNLLIGT